MHKIISILAVIFLPFFAVAEDKTFAKYDPGTVRIGTGTQNGVYYSVGNAICRIVNKNKDVLDFRCNAEFTNGSLYNIEGLKDGKFDFALMQSDIQAHSFAATSEFNGQEAFDKMRSMFSLHNEAFAIIAKKDSEIKIPDDLLGKIINIGIDNSSTRIAASTLFTAKSWTVANFKSAAELTDIEQSKALCDGKIDAIIASTGHPNSNLGNVMDLCETKMIPLDDQQIRDFVKSNKEYNMATIPGGIYSGIPQDIQTFGIKATFVTHAAMPEDVVYKVTKVIFEDLDGFKKLDPVLSRLTLQSMLSEGNTAPMHPGALKYFQEKGLSYTPQP